MSIISDLDLNVESELTFEFSVIGANKEDVASTLLLHGENGYDISIVGISDGQNLIFNLPKLEGIIQAGVVEFDLNVVIEGDKTFKPLSEQIQFIQPTSVEAKVHQVQTQREVMPTISVKVKTAESKKPTARDLIHEKCGTNAIIDSIKPDASIQNVWFAMIDDVEYIVNTNLGTVTKKS